MTALPRRIPPPAPRSGVVLGGRYRLAEPLGAGGTADVFRGVDVRLRRDVAVKVFRPGACAVTAERFCQEAELLGRLAHPALVDVHDVGRHASHVYVVMRLIEGVTLREHILDGPLAGDRVARLGARLASALEHVHAAGVVHRDVKPSNVLIGLDDAPYLADFGISRLVDEPTRSVPGTVVGTLPYLAPEQLLGRGSGPASDIYALGLVLLEALKGEREYPGGPLEAGTARVLRPPCIPAWAPAELAAVIETMTRTEPADRPDASECVRLLENAAAAEADPPRPASRGTDAGSSRAAPPAPASAATVPRQRRHRALAVALTTGLVLGAGGATMPFVLDAGPAHDAGPATPSLDRTHPAPPPAGTPATTLTLEPSNPPSREATPPPTTAPDNPGPDAPDIPATRPDMGKTGNKNKDKDPGSQGKGTGKPGAGTPPRIAHTLRAAG